MKIKYDPKVDALYIDLLEGTYNQTKKVTDSILIDITKDGKVLGIEILDASENIKHFDPAHFTVDFQTQTKQTSV